ncbi:hypothetical protein MY5147_008637 [Beauveria neobassiana]
MTGKLKKVGLEAVLQSKEGRGAGSVVKMADEIEPLHITCAVANGSAATKSTPARPHLRRQTIPISRAISAPRDDGPVSGLRLLADGTVPTWVPISSRFVCEMREPLPAKRPMVAVDCFSTSDNVRDKYATDCQAAFASEDTGKETTAPVTGYIIVDDQLRADGQILQARQRVRSPQTETHGTRQSQERSARRPHRAWMGMPAALAVMRWLTTVNS